jgi:glucosamine-6-phosphate deaminase
MIKETVADQLQVQIYEDRARMGAAAAQLAIGALRRRLAHQQQVNVIFAAAPSQNEFLASLAQARDLDWSRVNAFHMDEYVGLPEDAPQGFGNFLKAAIFSRVPFASVHYLGGNAPDPAAECDRYAALLQEYPTDIVFMGIGENTHIAFNDPHVADFNDPYLVKVVDLDQACRQQQVNDGCFATIDQVPTHALTLTVPALMRAQEVFCVVPGPNKAQAVYHTLRGAIVDTYPATALRRHPRAMLFLDRQSAGLVLEPVAG